MVALALLLLLQSPASRDLLAIEDARAEDVRPLIDALSDPDLQLQAIRAIGRLERPQLAGHLLQLRNSDSLETRQAVFLALAQMRADVEWDSLLPGQLAVEGIILEAMGRSARGDDESNFRQAIRPTSGALSGAVRGLYHLVRNTGKPLTDATVEGVRRLVAQDSNSVLVRRLALAMLYESGDKDLRTLTKAMDDPDPQVRMLAVRSLGAWKDDPSYLVRYEALKANDDCGRAEAALIDPSPHVKLLGVDLLGNDCPGAPLIELLEDSLQDWLTKAHALVSLARVEPDDARRFLPLLARQKTWWARAAAAEASKIIGEQSVRKELLLDRHPNVVAAALLHPDEAIDALESDDYGLLMKATDLLQDWPAGPSAAPALTRALIRATAEQRLTSRSPRLAMLGLLRAYGDDSVWPRLQHLLHDRDPLIAGRAAEILTEKTGTPAKASSHRLMTQPLPPEDYMNGLRKSRAVVRMRDAGTFVLEMIPEDAPVTVATFARLAESGYYTGLTFHRIVPNFVIQGGSPGANEYVGTDDFIRDEVGGSHLRGTVGISTRGRDTGDSQIFINLVDNYRLDYNYTVFARVLEGMEIVDQITQADVIADIRIVRRGEVDRERTPPQSFVAWTERQFPGQVYRKRRARAQAMLAESGTTLIVPSRHGRSGGETFRQAPNFLYLTGLEIPDAVLLLKPEGAPTLFVPISDSRFSGPGRPNDFPGSPLASDPKLARLSGIRDVRPIGELEAVIGEMALQKRALALDLGRSGSTGTNGSESPTLEQRLHSALTLSLPKVEFDNAFPVVARTRSIKGPEEIRALRKSASLTAEGIGAAAAQVRPGIDERTLEGILESAFKAGGAQRVAFDSIIKSGPNSLWPWRILAAFSDRRNRTMENGDLVIFDVGCELDHYVADVGRTFPVSGRFSPVQRRTLEMVTSVSDAIIAAVRPGITLSELTLIAQERMPEDQRKFMQTGLFFGHHIGLETGDPSLTDDPLEPGMVFTVEPWYYNHEIGLAVFVEDVILVTESGGENLTSDLPRDPENLEAMVRGRGR